MARSVKDIQYDLEEAQRAISGYRTLLSGGTVQKGSVSEGRYKGYIYDHQQKIKALKSELAEAKKAGFSNSFTNVKKGDRVSVKGAKKYDALSPDTVPGTVLFIHPDGKVAVQVGSGQMNVLPQDIINAYSNGRQKAETYLNQKMKEAGVKVENAKIVHVEKNRGGFSVYIDGKEADFASNQAELHAILRDYDSMGYRFDKNKSKM